MQWLKSDVDKRDNVCLDVAQITNFSGVSFKAETR